MNDGKIYQELDYGHITLKIGQIAIEKGETAYSLSKKTLIKHSTIKRYMENDVSRLDMETLAKVMFVLGITDFNKVFEYSCE